MLAHCGVVASCQPAATAKFFEDHSQHGSENSNPKFLACFPLGKFAGTGRVRLRVERVARATRTPTLRFCGPFVPTLSELEGSEVDGSRMLGFEAAILSGFEGGSASDGPEEGEWRSSEKDGGLGSLSASSRGDSMVFGSGGSRGFGAKSGTLQSLASPDRAAGRVGNGDEFSLAVNGHGGESSGQITATEEKMASSFPYLAADLPARVIFRKRGFGVALKPSQDTVEEDSPLMNTSRAINCDDSGDGCEPRQDVDYYHPKVGEEVIGVVVSGNAYKLDIDIGSEKLGRMLMKDVYPLAMFGSDDFLWRLPEEGGSLTVPPVGRVRVVRDEEDLDVTSCRVPVGSVLFMQVYGLALSGRPLLSVRKIASRIAWHRVRQIHQEDEPFDVQCLGWNSDGLVFKIEGLRALLPVNQFLNRARVPVSFKEHVGEWRNVLITDVDEATGKLLLSEKRAWCWRNAQQGSLVSGKVTRIHPFGVELKLSGTSLRAMVHISNISDGHVADITKVFSVGEEVKALVVKSPVPFKIALSTSDLESSRGLMLHDKKRVFREAEEIAARYLCNLSQAAVSDAGVKHDIDVQVEDPQCANHDWVDFGDAK